MHRRHLTGYLLAAAVLRSNRARGQGLGLGIGLDDTIPARSGTPAWVLAPGGIVASVDLDFLNNLYWQPGVTGSTAANFVTCSRASSGTNLLPTSASGFAYTTFANNVVRRTSGLGTLVEESRINRLLNSAVPVTQTTASLGTGTYTLWVNGSGTATPSGGTATITGAAAASNGSPNTFVITVAGTVVVTVAGSLNAFQLELGTFGTSLIVTTGSTATRAADVVTLTKVPSFGSAYTLFGKGTPNAPIAYAQFQGILTLSDNTTSNQAQIKRASDGTGKSQFMTALSGVTGLNNKDTALAQSASSKAALGVASGDQAWSTNGGTIGTGSTANVPTGASLTTVYIGAIANGTLPFDGHIERIALWATTRLPNASLVTVTT